MARCEFLNQTLKFDVALGISTDIEVCPITSSRHFQQLKGKSIKNLMQKYLLYLLRLPAYGTQIEGNRRDRHNCESRAGLTFYSIRFLFLNSLGLF